LVKLSKLRAVLRCLAWKVREARSVEALCAWNIGNHRGRLLEREGTVVKRYLVDFAVHHIHHLVRHVVVDGADDEGAVPLTGFGGFAV
jgi:hypothetical protein